MEKNWQLKKLWTKVKAYLEKRPRKVFWVGMLLLILSLGLSLFQYFFWDREAGKKEGLKETFSLFRWEESEVSLSSKSSDSFATKKVSSKKQLRPKSLKQLEVLLSELQLLEEKSKTIGLTVEDSLRVQILSTQLKKEFQ